MDATPDKTSDGTKAMLRAVPFTAVEFHDLFWAPRLAAVRARTVPILFRRCVDAGMIKSLDVDTPPPPLRIPIGHWGGTTQMFWDSDLGKWIEAAAYTLAVARDPELEADIDGSPTNTRRRSARTATQLPFHPPRARTSAGPTCATGTSSIAPAISSRARSRISRRPASARCST